MNDPWSVLIETLVGTERETPARWSARRVHLTSDRMPGAGRKARTAARPMDALSRIARGGLAAPISRLRCACAECAGGPRLAGELV